MSYWGSRAAATARTLPRAWQPGDPMPSAATLMAEWPMEPTQFFTSRLGRPDCDGIQLRAAVLVSAIRDATGNGVIINAARRPNLDRARSARLQREALAWFASDDVEWPYSFLNICEALRLHPRTVRERLPTLGSVAVRTGYRTPLRGLTVPRTKQRSKRA